MKNKTAAPGKTSSKPKRETLTPLPKLIEQTQEKVNKAIRERDVGSTCISCGSDKANQAGHYFAVKKSSILRFHPVNINLQCAYCNCYLHGNEAFYRIGLVEKWGEELVRELEQLAVSQRLYKWSRMELMEIQEALKHGTYGKNFVPFK
ncbi:MAG: hypothetical protein EOP04_06950 [Proteobacteria bacterium]|nr:MAG: hypothetical protein EOP04_06950 [Pseudomonadota bacterium]